jgi:hypothetical protein
MSAVVQADSTMNAIRQKVRRLTASSGNSSLTTNDIDAYVNTFYSQDFAYAIKLDQLRSVYSFFTSPYVDRYPLNVNYNQGIRNPAYCDGIEMNFFKDRQQFYNMWPKFPTLSYPITGDGTTQAFTFTCSTVPFYSYTVTLGGTDTNGNPIRVGDVPGIDINGDPVNPTSGALVLEVPNPVEPQPPAPLAPYSSADIPPGYLTTTQVARTFAPGMVNNNVNNSGDNLYQPIIGTVNYVTGQFSVDFSLVNLTPIAGQNMNLYISQYTTGRPFTLLFWNNEFQIRPVPKLVHKIEVETYMTPVQFLSSTDSPTLNQWWQYIAYGAACEILRDRQDMEGLQNLMEGMKRQEQLVLERQGVEEINQRNTTIFSATQTANGWNLYGSWGGWY